MTPSVQRLSATIADVDCWRGPSLDAPRNAPHKEWQHFLVFGPGWSLLFNLNLDAEGMGRVITIAHGASWHGEVSRCDEARYRIGQLDATFGLAGMRWRAGRYEIWQRGPGPRLEVTLQPNALPSLSHNIPLGGGAALSWCLVPRLEASGWAEIDGRTERFDGCVAYHDHNWGHFAWGGNFSWDWGCAVPESRDCPFAVVFARMNDRGRHSTRATSLFVLHEGRHLRFFRNAEVEFESEGFVDSRPDGRIPPAAGLLVPDEDFDVPKRLRVRGSGAEDHLRLELECVGRGQVLVPSNTDPRRIVRVNEAGATVRVHGRCGGQPIDFEGPGILEVVRG